MSERSGAWRRGRRRLAVGAVLALALPLLARAPEARAGIGDALAAQLATAPADRAVPVIVTLARQVRPERYTGRAPSSSPPSGGSRTPHSRPSSRSQASRRAGSGSSTRWRSQPARR